MPWVVVLFEPDGFLGRMLQNWVLSAFRYFSIGSVNWLSIIWLTDFGNFASIAIIWLNYSKVVNWLSKDFHRGLNRPFGVIPDGWSPLLLVDLSAGGPSFSENFTTIYGRPFSFGIAIKIRNVPRFLRIISFASNTAEHHLHFVHNFGPDFQITWAQRPQQF